MEGEDKLVSVLGALGSAELEVLEGWSEIRRTACVMVGWKGPPNGECLRRCVGSTWPEKNQADRIL